MTHVNAPTAQDTDVMASFVDQTANNGVLPAAILATVTIASDNTATTLAKTLDTVTLTIVSDKDLGASGTFTTTIGGVAATMSGGASNWVATRQLDGSSDSGIIGWADTTTTGPCMTLYDCSVFTKSLRQRSTMSYLQY